MGIEKCQAGETSECEDSIYEFVAAAKQSNDAGNSVAGMGFFDARMFEVIFFIFSSECLELRLGIRRLS